MRKNTVLIRASVGCAALAAVGFVAACGGGGDDRVGKATDATIGECITISGGGDKETKVDVDKASCDPGDRLTFYAASVIKEGEKCANENYSTLTFDDKSKLCITPNFVAGGGYPNPMGSGLPPPHPLAYPAHPAFEGIDHAPRPTRAQPHRG